MIKESLQTPYIHFLSDIL